MELEITAERKDFYRFGGESIIVGRSVKVKLNLVLTALDSRLIDGTWIETDKRKLEEFKPKPMRGIIIDKMW